MDMLNFIKSRRSTRKYMPCPVEPEKTAQIIEAGTYAPSGGNNQSWHFTVIEDKAVLARLAELAEAAFAKMTYDENTYSSLVGSIRASRRGGYVFHYHAPVLIIVGNRRGYGNAMADSACAMENMMLMANALDLGSCWINQLHWLDEDPQVRATLEAVGLGADETVTGGVSLGYPAKEDAFFAWDDPAKDPVTYVR